MCTCWLTVLRPSCRGFSSCDNVMTLSTSVWLGWSLLLPRGDRSSSVDATVVAQMPFQPEMSSAAAGGAARAPGASPPRSPQAPCSQRAPLTPQLPKPPAMPMPADMETLRLWVPTPHRTRSVVSSHSRAFHRDRQ